MTSNVLVNSPEIIGNIGQCQTHITQVVTDKGFFASDVANILTNSCTGVVETFNTWELSDPTFFLLIALVILSIFVGVALFIKITE